MSAAQWIAAFEQMAELAGLDRAGDHWLRDAQRCAVPGASSPAETNSRSRPTEHPSRLESFAGVPMSAVFALEQEIAIYAAALDEAQQARIDAENRLAALTRPTEHGGKGLPDICGPVQLQRSFVEVIRREMEAPAARALTKAMRRHPLGPWVARTTGIGESGIGRLFGQIGDPCWHPLKNRPRRLGELRAYCGLHVLHDDQPSIDSQRRPVVVQPLRPDNKWNEPHSQRVGTDLDHPAHQTSANSHRLPGGVAPRRRRGERANWNSRARSVLYTIADSAIRLDGKPDKNGRRRARSPYRDVYEAGRAKYECALHGNECSGTDMVLPGVGIRRVYCKTESGARAGLGDPLSPSHQHSRALRLVMRQILKDLWTESKRLHESGEWVA
jgi:hypothetical protein